MELINFTASNPVVVDGINTSTETGSVTANVVEPGYTTPNFSIFCVDLNRDIYPDPYSSGNQNTNLPYTIEPLAQELATIAGTSAANSGRIAYLYNTYGQASLTASEAAGLQLAIWELEYDANPSDVTSGEFQVAGGTDPNAIATANACLADSVARTRSPSSSTVCLIAGKLPVHKE